MRAQTLNRLLTLWQVVNSSPLTTHRNYTEQLFLLIARHEPHDLSALLKESGLPKAQLSRLLAPLLSAQLIELHENPTDRRAKYAQLTPQGTALVKQIVAALETV